MPAAPKTISEPPMPAAPTQLSTFQLHTAFPELVVSHRSQTPRCNNPTLGFRNLAPEPQNKVFDTQNSEPALLEETTEPTLGNQYPPEC